MNDIKTTFRTLLIGIIIITIPITVVGLIIVKNNLEYLFGIGLGTMVAIGVLKHMQITVLKTVEKTPKAAQSYAIKNYMIRYFIIISVLMVGIISKEVSVIGIFLGIFSIKISAYLFPYVNNINKKKLSNDI